MIETPAAAVVADSFVKDVEFFSIGTNDLTQYTLAVDRSNAALAMRFEPLHPAVLRLIKSVVDVATQHRIDVAVCGEMASDPVSAFALIGLGLRQLSVAPRAVGRIKRLIRGIRASTAADAVTRAMRTDGGAPAEALLTSALERELDHAV
jgi:phosphotransferase system enzyme I (PtsI)